MESISTLQTTDWNEEWKLLQQTRKRADDVEVWNKRALANGYDTPSAYILQFMELTDLLPGEIVFDMGCGDGKLAVAYAQAGHHVLAADFSPEMLKKTQQRALQHGLENVDTKLLSWQDNWKEAGVAADSVDVAVASRSIATEDLRDALSKLGYVARRRCCITLTTSSSPHVDEFVLRECDIENRHGRDFQYALNILINDGFKPTCSYIRSERKDTFDSLDHACCKLDRMLTSALGTNCSEELVEARLRLRDWLKHNLIENEEAGLPDSRHGTQKALRLPHNRQFNWAFIAWEPN